MKFSVAFVTLYKHDLDTYLNYKDDNEQFNFIDEFLLSSTKSWFTRLLIRGGGGMTIVLEGKIEEIREDIGVSEFENFLCVFIYADLRERKICCLNE